MGWACDDWVGACQSHRGRSPPRISVFQRPIVASVMRETCAGILLLLPSIGLFLADGTWAGRDRRLWGAWRTPRLGLPHRPDARHIHGVVLPRSLKTGGFFQGPPFHFTSQSLHWPITRPQNQPKPGQTSSSVPPPRPGFTFRASGPSPSSAPVQLPTRRRLLPDSALLVVGVGSGRKLAQSNGPGGNCASSCGTTLFDSLGLVADRRWKEAGCGYEHDAPRKQSREPPP